MRTYNKAIDQEDIEDSLYTVEEFNNMKKSGYITSYDGFGYYARNNHCNENDEVFSNPPLDATHVLWYNK